MFEVDPCATTAEAGDGVCRRERRSNNYRRTEARRADGGSKRRVNGYVRGKGKSKRLPSLNYRSCRLDGGATDHYLRNQAVYVQFSYFLSSSLMYHYG